MLRLPVSLALALTGCIGLVGEPTTATTTEAVAAYSTGTLQELLLSSKTADSGLTIDLARNQATVTATSSEGYVDFRWDAGYLGNQIQLDLDRVNLINDGEFASGSDGRLAGMTDPNNLGYGMPSWFASGGTAVPTPRTWFLGNTSRQDQTMPTPFAGKRKLSSSAALGQIVPIRGGEDYFLTLSMNTLGMYRDSDLRPSAWDELGIYVSFLDTSFRMLTFFDLAPNGTSSTIQGGKEATSARVGRYLFDDSMLERYKRRLSSDADAYVTKTLRLRALDCDPHAMYDGTNSATRVTTTDTLTVNYCTTDGSAGGTPFASAATVADYLARMKYMLVTFRHSNGNPSTSCPSNVTLFSASGGDCNGVVIDSVKLDPIQQATIQVLDANGAVLLESNQDKGFFLDAGRISGTPTTLRVKLRSYDAQTPTLRHVYVTSGVDVTVAANSATLYAPPATRFEIASVSQPPIAEYGLHWKYATSTPRTTCTNLDLSADDPAANPTTQTCLDVQASHNMGAVFAGDVLTSSVIPIRWDTATQDYVVGWDFTANGFTNVIGQTIGGSAQRGLAGALKRLLKDYRAHGFSMAGTLMPIGAYLTAYASAITYRGVMIGDQTTFDQVCPFRNSVDIPADYDAATVAQQHCCFSSRSALVSFNANGISCPLGALRDLATSRTAVLTGVEQAKHLLGLYHQFYYDLFSGRTSVTLYDGVYDPDYSSATPTFSYVMPQVDQFALDFEVNDNNTVPPGGGCTSVGADQGWKFVASDPDITLCRSHNAVCPGGSTCVYLTDLWDELATNLQTYNAHASVPRAIKIELPYSNKRYNNTAQNVDYLWWNDVLTGGAGGTNGFTMANYNRVSIQSVTVAWDHPEVMYDGIAALSNVFEDRTGTAIGTGFPLRLTDVRNATAGLYDPKCSDYLDRCTSTTGRYYDGVHGTRLDATEISACRAPDTASITHYTHFSRGWGKDEGEKMLIRNTLVGLSLPTDTLAYTEMPYSFDKTGNSNAYWNSSHPEGDRCWKTSVDANIVRHDETSTAHDLLSASAAEIAAIENRTTTADSLAATEYGRNLGALAHQTLYHYLGTAKPMSTSVVVSSSTWVLDGERYFSALLQSATDSTVHYLALWWYPEYIYGHSPDAYAVGRATSQFQLFSRYLDSGYTEQRLVNVHLASLTDAATATWIPLDGGASSALAIEHESGTAIPILKSVRVGELPVLIKLTGATLGAAVGDADGDGYAWDVDCDDQKPTIHPGAFETIGDGIDENCDGHEVCFIDADGDGYGSAALGATIVSADLDCTDPGELSAKTSGVVALDCDDGNAGVNPGATERCNGVDDNCNGQTDESWLHIYYRDGDGDGYGDSTAPTGQLCSPPTGYVTNSLDCNDGKSAIHPGAAESPGDEIDQNCDNHEDCFGDADGDGYSSQRVIVHSSDLDCRDRGEARTTTPAGDCDDGNAAMHPGAAEIVGDELDQNCDGREQCYADNDRDHARSMAATVSSADLDCRDPGEALATSAIDCNDSNAAVSTTSAFYWDGDADGFTAVNPRTTTSCGPPVVVGAGRWLTSPSRTADCCDADATRH